MDKKLRNVLITGANKGIGLALVKKLCSLEKYYIIMAFRSGNNGVKQYQQLKVIYPKCSLYYQILDITNYQGINNFIINRYLKNQSFN